MAGEKKIHGVGDEAGALNQTPTGDQTQTELEKSGPRRNPRDAATRNEPKEKKKKNKSPAQNESKRSKEENWQ